MDAEGPGAALGYLGFVGGCATGLLISDPAAADATPDEAEGAPACRWRKGDLIIDVMPTEERILGFTSRWEGPAIGAARPMGVGGFNIRAITPEAQLRP